MLFEFVGKMLAKAIYEVWFVKSDFVQTFSNYMYQYLIYKNQSCL